MVKFKSILSSLLRILRYTLIGIFALLVLLTLLVYLVCVRMPGDTLKGPLPPATADETKLAAELEKDVRYLSETIGVRCLARGPETLAQTADYIESELKAAGAWQVKREIYEVDGHQVANLVAELPGTRLPDSWIVIGGHYDTVPTAPGADDNASAIAGLLATARRLGAKAHDRSLRLVAYVNEEPPYFQTERMGSLVNARASRLRNEQIEAVVVYEMLGCFSDDADSQHYPPPFSYFYPSVGNFIAFVGNLDSRALVHDLVEGFREQGRLPSDGLASPDMGTGIGFSDHWSYWQVGYPAVMVTDTAFFRYAHYHKPTDTADKLDFQRMARVISGLMPVIKSMLDKE
ncbi:MAG: M28 family peptidase [Deltaproteobacteria bacterium]|nr:M28 family peptidase [Deltaproteobacteria bacterium]